MVDAPAAGLSEQILVTVGRAADEGALVAYLAPEDRVQELGSELEELGRPPLATVGRLLLARGPACDPAWAAHRWLDPRVLRVASIKDAARQLRELQRGWAAYSAWLHRRTRLIEEALPHVSGRPLRFPDPPPSAPLGSFTLLDAGHVLASPRCDSPVPHGEWRFVEDREGPPSRAYLKLWEAFTRLGDHPRPGQRCLDLGASPGGFTWVCQQLGAEVTAVDKAPLDPAVAGLPRVRVVQASAFALDPADYPPVDWLLSDVVCYPARLLRLIERWIASGRASRIVATIKLQGTPDPDAVRAFRNLPGRVVHLHHNKHELTYLCHARPA